MQKDFHYYCIFVLANLAGFSQDEAKIVAYCSQYVDDSKDSKQIKIGDYKYDTVRTAHTGIKSFSWNVHKKVYFPFHFIPTRPLDDKPFTYITEADSTFAQELVKDALDDESDLRLYRMGVALHTYADTWAHEHFSGRKHKENDVRGIWKYENNKWKNCTKPWDFLVDFFRKRVGHIQAFKHPDYAYENWKYKDHRKSPHERVNSEHFIKAAYTILEKLAKAKGTSNIDGIWENNKSKIKNLFETPPPRTSNELEVRCNRWIEEYKDFFKSNGDLTKYLYSPDEWREKAMQSADDGNLEKFLQTDWAQFQRAALKQRYFVLERLM